MLPSRFPLAAALMIAAGLCATHSTRSDAGSFFGDSADCDVRSCAQSGTERLRVTPEASLAGIELRTTEIVLHSAATTPSGSSLRPKDCRTQVCLDTRTHFFFPRIAANGTHTTGVSAEAMGAVGPGRPAVTAAKPSVDRSRSDRR